MTQNQSSTQQPIIPPFILVGLAVVGLLVAFASLLVSGALGIVGWAALGVGALALVALVVLAPQTVLSAFSGRNFRFGGTSVLVTVVLLGALIAAYVIIANFEVVWDVTGNDEFKLNTQAQEAITALGADPNIQAIELIAFYDSSLRSEQERRELLFQDYVNYSNNKVSYRLEDPNRNPTLAQFYTAVNGDIVVQLAGNEDPAGVEKVQTAFGFDQNQITNAILSIASSGDFRAYFLNIDSDVSSEDTEGLGASEISGILSDRLRWTVNEVSSIDLLSTGSEFELLDETADGEVLVVIGGNRELREEEVELITNYVSEGGHLVLMAAPDIDGLALASTGTLNDWLKQNVGLSFSTDVVIDPSQNFQSPYLPAITDLDTAQYITSNMAANNGALVLQLPRQIVVETTLPEDVTVTPIARTSEGSYLKSVESLLAEDIEPTEDTVKGPFVVMAVAENSNSGARVVLVGSQDLASNQFGSINLDVSLSTIVWATNYQAFFESLPRVASDEFNQDIPIVATNDVINQINFVNLFALPFGILFIGGFVWWNRRK